MKRRRTIRCSGRAASGAPLNGNVRRHFSAYDKLSKSDMNGPEHSQRPPAPLGSIEPHAPLLCIPPEDQLLYKVMTVENLLRSVAGNYLHFNRVDSYSDLPNADK